jgi:SpoVK/Ycf46/Vps4 family AAA+-type ATPase
LRAIRSGKLSADRNSDNTFSIDPAELARAFPPTAPKTDQVEHHGTAGLERENQVLREMIADLRHRLDQAEEERRRLRSAPMVAPVVRSPGRFQRSVLATPQPESRRR